jgi:hypothetical protein
MNNIINETYFRRPEHLKYGYSNDTASSKTVWQTQCKLKVHDIIIFPYSAVHGFWLMKELAELVDGLTGCGEGMRGGCLFPWNFSMTRPNVFREVERRPRPHTMLLVHYWLTPSILFENSTSQKLCTALYMWCQWCV